MKGSQEKMKEKKMDIEITSKDYRNEKGCKVYKK